ncbi:YciI family protein [Oryzibacter oryziterrae]|uniref:YciI family protein n=1 Tax=Oryzibacter oryziterrae TaxID=2766474 RepID=UPI001F313252|nr:YciI family protein [Oryzibacter oryziterrae]
MHFIVSCTDKPDHMAVRLENRPAHVEFLKANASSIPVAGPYISIDGTAMLGSMLIIEAESVEAVEAILAQDPYAKAGLFEAVSIKPWKWVIGAPQA